MEYGHCCAKMRTTQVRHLPSDILNGVDPIYVLVKTPHIYCQSNIWALKYIVFPPNIGLGLPASHKGLNKNTLECFM